ncbi:hypothetical protein [Leptolyngbya sp. FACHB-261]|uniref:hypothetical protein n=1 Tax=Leptolyngbya sp. FACHB-261 TaxID=2692806 RepID=UPI001684BACE|nr:hypothetical protein [Leptolyngbya sp. FACHB-261]MBD2104882.1 hypothetical protein [Leptolyngbya sp. FACHB-261]
MALSQATPNPAVMQAVEKLNYRVTVGDVAARAGLDVKLAQRELLTLAQSAGGHLQVAESGEIAYVYPNNFRDVLRSKYFRLQLQEQWQKIWKILFYLLRISFGVVLVTSIVLVIVAIFIIMTAMRSSDDNGNSNDRDGGGMFYMPGLFYWPDLFWFFSPNYYDERPYTQRRGSEQKPQMNFLEAVFSFLFGDGNPNANLEERRWQTIGSLIRRNRGVAIAEQVAPYLDDLGSGFRNEYEDYMLPVLTRFNGQPEVSPEGDLVYRFPELQATAFRSRGMQIPEFLRELRWKFSEATSGQLTLAGILGGVNVVAVLILGGLLRSGAAELGGLVGFASGIYGILLAYGIGFLVIPLVRYLWLRGRNAKVEARNAKRQQQAAKLRQSSPEITRKLTYAQQFAAEQVISEEDLAYTTEQDLLDQESANSRKIDEEWNRRLNQGDR